MKRSATFTITILDNLDSNGLRNVVITTTADGYINSPVTIAVSDNDGPASASRHTRPGSQRRGMTVQIPDEAHR